MTDRRTKKELYLNPSLQRADVRPLIAAAVQMSEDKTQVHCDL